ncbi:MAG: beta strand repeat-containing protein [Gemmatimonadaceae bacterium]
MQKLTRSLLAFGVLAGLAACGDDVSIVDPKVTPAVTGITVSPSSATLVVGATAQLSAVVTTNDPSVATTVTWASSNTAVATVSSTGLVTAVTAGSATVTATSTANTTFRAGAQITVEAGVRSVRVSPDNAIVPTGSTLQLVANVDAAAGVARTVTWTSSNAAVATVGSTTGVVTGVSRGTATIIAASTVSPTVTGAAAITVRDPVPATVSISSITTGATFIPVNVNNVFGQIEVTLNVDPGDSRITRVEVLIDGNVAGSQAFSTTRNIELALSHVFANVEAAPVTISINTAVFSATTGVPTFFNGPRQLSARAILATGAQVATPSQQLVFNNANTLIATQTFTGTTATASNAAGFVFKRGGLSVSILPVIYNQGQSIAAGGTASFGSGACDAAGVGTRTVALVAPAAGSSAFTATFSSTATPAGAGNVTNYEFNSCGIFNATGEVVTVTAADNNGNTLFAAAVPANAATLGTRLDNRAPGAPTFMANPNIRQNGWLNAAVGLTGLNTSLTDNDWLVNGAADAGVGGYVRLLRTGAGPTVNAAIAATASATPTLPAPTLNNNDLCAVISAADLLGNESARPASGTVCTSPPPVASSTPVLAQHLSFGVDIAAPTIAFSGGLASQARLNGATVGTEFQVAVTDTGAVGNSGMLSTSAVRGTVQIRNATSAAICFVGTVVLGVCTPVSVNAAPPFPLVPTTTVAAATTPNLGYFTYVAFSQDAAGNQSGTVTRVIAYDPAANVPSLTTALFNTPLSGATATFNANASDNFDLRDVTYRLSYAGGIGGPILYPVVVLNTFDAATLVNSNVAAGITINGFMRQLENVTANNPVTVGGQFKPTNLAGIARDQANNQSATANTPIPAASVTTGVSYLAAAAPQLIRSWAITAPSVATNVSTGATTPAANPLSVTLTIDAFGPTATFTNPFTRVDMYAVLAGDLVQIGTASFVGTTDDGSAFGRRHRYTFTWTPGTAFGVGVQTLFAIGVNANGDALVTLGNALITTTNP